MEGLKSTSSERVDRRDGLLYIAFWAGLFLLSANIALSVSLLVIYTRHSSMESHRLQQVAESACATGLNSTNFMQQVKQSMKELPVVDKIQEIRPVSASDKKWLSSEIIIFENITSSARYRVEGVELHPDLGIVLVHTASQNKSFAWFEDSQQIVELSETENPLQDLHSRRLLWTWAGAFRVFGSALSVAGWLFG
uniref:Uncharacterized protein n=1 Tax=Tetraselmis sp. GSL018 TaxID=582737 RepID=A0A061S821_9CHLO|eukprot:CAMPEP_0177600146 /NCGR_PEP_ID=MMETSP0419_2-20121207/13440_1 /TAXON_ID=582737 /ORGANISM="Tetraselmis sp., Strain GSL018" /LENGTH=194 /DNA_ID=CAMNT_0019093065 /DNA_START=33 /DNA_END=617 /DNA_ORIENTATION=-